MTALQNPVTIKKRSQTRPSPWDPEKQDWAELLHDHPSYRLDQLWHGLYQNYLLPAEVSSLPKSLRETLANRYAPRLTRLTQRFDDADSTVKSLWETEEQKRFESVLMHYRQRSTVCISSQAGCAMGCVFCATGQGGFQANLTVGEILEQVIAASRDAANHPSGPKRLSNVVYMGMGEPLANYTPVLTSIRRLIDDIGIGARKITISTVGLAPQIERLAEERLQVGLALSLHAANDELRTSLIPLNKRHPISELVLACRHFREVTGRRVTFEWAMMDRVNDSAKDADELAALARSAQAHVNLIPLNPTPGWPSKGSNPKQIELFAQLLKEVGTNVTVRANRGTSIDAACGQLNSEQTSEQQRTGQIE